MWSEQPPSSAHSISLGRHGVSLGKVSSQRQHQALQRHAHSVPRTVHMQHRRTASKLLFPGTPPWLQQGGRCLQRGSWQGEGTGAASATAGRACPRGGPPACLGGCSPGPAGGLPRRRLALGTGGGRCPAAAGGWRGGGRGQAVGGGLGGACRGGRRWRRVHCVLCSGRHGAAEDGLPRRQGEQPPPVGLNAQNASPDRG